MTRELKSGLLSLPAVHTMVQNMGTEVTESVFRTQFTAFLESLKSQGHHTHLRVRRTGNGVSEAQYFVTMGTAAIPIGYPRQIVVPAHSCPPQEFLLNYYIDTCADEYKYTIIADSAADAIAAAQAFVETRKSSVTQAMLVDAYDVFVWEI